MNTNITMQSSCGQHKDYYQGFSSQTFMQLPELQRKVDSRFHDFDLLDAAIFWATNTEREKHGLKPLEYHHKLRQMANLHSCQMRLHRFFSHENPHETRYKTLTDRLESAKDDGFKGFTTFGENIAYSPTLKGLGTFTMRTENNTLRYFDVNGNQLFICTCREFAQSVVNGWMHSPGHRANILDADYEFMACGSAGMLQKDTYLPYYYLTQNFGGKAVSVAPSTYIRSTFNPCAENTSINTKLNASLGGWGHQTKSMMNNNDFNGDVMPGGYSPENGEEKTLCVFLLDNSGSMGDNGKIQALNNGLQQFYNDILSDDALSQKLEVAIISFNSNVSYLQQPALVQDITMPTLQASGGTDMVGGLQKALEVIQTRKEYWKAHGIAHKRPWLVMITDGYANVDSIKDQIKKDSAAKHFFLLPIAVDDMADMNVLNSVASTKALKLGEGKFSAFFQWLSNSMAAIANADGPTVALDNPFGTFAVDA